jgi:hypothetical protein
MSLFLLLFGLYFKKYEFAIAGSILLLIIGLSIFGFGINIPVGWIA